MLLVSSRKESNMFEINRTVTRRVIEKYYFAVDEKIMAELNHYLPLTVVEVYVNHLLLQFVVERSLLAIYHLLIVGRVGIAVV